MNLWITIIEIIRTCVLVYVIPTSRPVLMNNKNLCVLVYVIPTSRPVLINNTNLCVGGCYPD